MLNWIFINFILCLNITIFIFNLNFFWFREFLIFVVMIWNIRVGCIIWFTINPFRLIKIFQIINKKFKYCEKAWLIWNLAKSFVYTVAFKLSLLFFLASYSKNKLKILKIWTKILTITIKIFYEVRVIFFILIVLIQIFIRHHWRHA